MDASTQGSAEHRSAPYDKGGGKQRPAAQGAGKQGPAAKGGGKQELMADDWVLRGPGLNSMGIGGRTSAYWYSHSLGSTRPAVQGA